MSSSSQADQSWISLFCSLVGHEYFAEVSEDFIEDDFNLTGLQSQVSSYKEALEMILDVEPETDYSGEDDDEPDDDEEDPSELNSDDEAYRAVLAEKRRQARVVRDYQGIESSAEMLYGLIHQRFITSRQGIQQMLEKYEIGHFGTCPRVHCRGAKVLPVGCSDIPGQDTVKLFCPACLDVYAPPNSRFQSVDGAFFGTTFGCLFFMTFPELDVAGTKKLDAPLHAGNPPPAEQPAAAAPQKHSPEAINGVAAHNLAPGLGRASIFEPRIYGFRVSELARTGPRMKWLRQKPERLEELDEVAIWESNAHPAMEEEEEEMVEERGEEDEDEVVEGEVEIEGEVEDDEAEGGQGVLAGEEGHRAKGGEKVDDGGGRGKKGRQRVNGAVVGA